MKQFMVYTENGDYRIYAWSGGHAMMMVERITLGRCGMVLHVEEA